MLLKSIAAELKDIDAKDGIVTAYVSAFGNQDSDGDIIERGAYSRTIRERGPEGSDRIKVLYQHDWRSLIGRPLELTEDDHGLLARFKVSPTSIGRDALILYADGVITEHSVGIDILRRSDTDRARVMETELWEFSPVTWGANALTPTLDVKALTKGLTAPEAVEARVREHLAAMRKALREPLTDETAGLLEIAALHLETELADLTKAHTAPDPAPGGDGFTIKTEADALRALVANL